VAGQLLSMAGWPLFPNLARQDMSECKITELAKRHGLSRTTLLYYDRIGLLSPSYRSAAGYRVYDEEDQERLALICAYREAGLRLDSIRGFLDSDEGPYAEVLQRRIGEIGAQVIALKRKQRLLTDMLRGLGTTASTHAVDKRTWVAMLRGAGMDAAGMAAWHREFEQRAPEAHHEFLLSLGIQEKEALEIRRKSAEAEGDRPSSTRSALPVARCS
jgi:DNA-binding transcriptional MerR regulator